MKPARHDPSSVLSSIAGVALVAAVVATAGASLGCASGGTFSKGVYTSREARYRVGQLPAAWERVTKGEADLAFRHRGGGVIAASGVCHQLKDVSLEILTGHLLLGFDDRRVREQTELVLDGRRALRSVVDGTVDGVAVEMALVVVRKDDCVYDLQLLSGPKVFASRAPDFDRFVQAFSALGFGRQKTAATHVANAGGND